MLSIANIGRFYPGCIWAEDSSAFPVAEALLSASDWTSSTAARASSSGRVPRGTRTVSEPVSLATSSHER
jgi:hypothetical protein